MSDTKHTPEPWEVGRCEKPFYAWPGQILGMNEGGDFILASCNQNYPEIAVANARRIVACVNACAGIPIEALNQLKPGDLSKLFFDHWEAD